MKWTALTATTAQLKQMRNNGSVFNARPFVRPLATKIQHFYHDSETQMKTSITKEEKKNKNRGVNTRLKRRKWMNRIHKRKENERERERERVRESKSMWTRGKNVRLHHPLISFQIFIYLFSLSLSRSRAFVIHHLFITFLRKWILNMKFCVFDRDIEW